MPKPDDDFMQLRIDADRNAEQAIAKTLITQRLDTHEATSSPHLAEFMTAMLVAWFTNRVERPPRKPERDALEKLALRYVGEFNAAVRTAVLGRKEQA